MMWQKCYSASVIDIQKCHLECLTKILATSMCILSGQRSQTMNLLNTNYMHIDENHCIFYIASLLKTTAPQGKSSIEMSSISNNYDQFQLRASKSHINTCQGGRNQRGGNNFAN